jgi:formamidopyrimidine-DNA glycosylase
MPELPEVETVVRGLRRTVLGRRIVSVTLGKTNFIDDPTALEQHLPGRVIDAVDRHGKFMLLRFSAVQSGGRPVANGDALPASLLVHLGMTGQIGPSPAAQPAEKHTHVTFALDDGRELRYVDPRRFGRMAYLTEAMLAEEIRRSGADPLEVSAEEFASRIITRSARIKAMLLDQSVLRGVGNIYADESLWRAKIHPARVGTKISKKEAELLRRALKDILEKAIVLRGSSISDFVDATGEPGEYQLHHRAYGREGRKCFRCGEILRRGIVAGRSSFFCPRCQPAPRGFKALALPASKVARSKRTVAADAAPGRGGKGKSSGKTRGAKRKLKRKRAF